MGNIFQPNHPTVYSPTKTPLLVDETSASVYFLWGIMNVRSFKPLSTHYLNLFEIQFLAYIFHNHVYGCVAVDISWRPEFLPPNIKAKGLPSSAKTMDAESSSSLNVSPTPAPIMQSARPSPQFPYLSASISLTLPAVHLLVLPHLNTRDGNSTVFASSFLSLQGGGSQ